MTVLLDEISECSTNSCWLFNTRNARFSDSQSSRMMYCLGLALGKKEKPQAAEREQHTVAVTPHGARDFCGLPVICTLGGGRRLLRHLQNVAGKDGRSARH
jgi:hypothetical protein